MAGSDSEVNRDRRPLIYMILGTLAVIILVALYIWGIGYRPAYSADRAAAGAVNFGRTASGQKTATIKLNIVQSVGLGPNAPWLGYQTRTSPPHPGTIFTVPAHALVTVDIHNFDSATNPRNEYFSLVQGTIGGVEYVNGKKIRLMNPNDMSHTFTIPDIGVSVPMMGIPSNAKPNQFEDMRFTFRAPGPGVYRWQCFVPCGWGTYGNGGPMSELGYMSGIMTVSASA